ncbi:hypothetical protein GS597_09075 [Synechococcales cyanobacterium C]|uniref:Uncharacterized protein n=1 Tax=Petrachloros mirabilis ULC683 TaxID=2781853 RepID=A0A8K2A7X6_9CYAN|nr:hypothetical protein [Petrachloros mirabilis]NCJ06654.1 hypothetical protein [Petrachloros mirabilis ULC683]
MNPYIHPIKKTEAHFRQSYPWRAAEPDQRKCFYEWLGRRLEAALKAGFSAYEAGFRHALNCEKTELDLEKLFMSWDVFTEAEAERRQAEELYQTRLAALSDELPPVADGEAEGAPSAHQHLVRLRALWKHPKMHQFVRQRIKDNPNWGIEIGSNGPEVK